MMLPFHIFVSLLYIIKDIADVKCNEWVHNPEIDQHLQMGRELLSQGLYDDALSHYHAAVDIINPVNFVAIRDGQVGRFVDLTWNDPLTNYVENYVDADPYNYLTYYTRATLYLAIGKIASALKDLTKVIELKPDFASARVQRGNLYLKQGRLDEAHIDYEFAIRIDPYNPEANQGYSLVDPLKRNIQIAYDMFADRNYHEAISLLSQLLQQVPLDARLREMRAQCYEAVGDIVSAISDLRTILVSLKSNTENQLRYLKLSQLYYEIGETEEALNAIRECLRNDQDHKGCFTHYKHIKKVADHLKAIQKLMQEENYVDCIARAEKAIPLETKIPFIMFTLKSKLCICQNKAGKASEAINTCTEALKIRANDVDALCERGDAHLNNENYSEAIQDFQKAININEHSQRANEGLRRAQKLEKQSKKRNYYAILGVKRTASKKEILKAYRKQAQKWHPDNFQGDEKAKAEKKFIDIAAAKEVLTDPEKRQKFDNGEDPLDPESQQGFNPFQQGFNPFERGSPFTFKFHFS